MNTDRGMGSWSWSCGYHPATRLHGVTTQNTRTPICTAARTSNLRWVVIRLLNDAVSSAHIMQCQMRQAYGMIVKNDESGEMCKKAAGVYLRYFSGISLKKLRKALKALKIPDLRSRLELSNTQMRIRQITIRKTESVDC